MLGKGLQELEAATAQYEGETVILKLAPLAQVHPVMNEWMGSNHAPLVSQPLRSRRGIPDSSPRVPSDSTNGIGRTSHGPHLRGLPSTLSDDLVFGAWVAIIARPGV